MAGKLDHIDRDLARLLARRIELLVSEGAVRGEAASFEDAGVPEFVWRSVVEGTTAAAAASKDRAAVKEPPRRCVVIGKRGVMGSFFAGRLEAYGHTVEGFGHAGWGHGAEELLAEAELVVVSVPIDRVEEIVRRAASHMRPGAVLADVTSVKAPPFRAMMDAHAGPVVGLHPMFGPGAETFLSQVVVVCRGRGGESYRWLIELMEADGAKLIESSPEEHDGMMVAVQAARHFLAVTMGAFLTSEGVDVARSLEFASPVYRLEIDMLGRLFAQDAWLYVDIMLATPGRREAIGRLAGKCSELAELAAKGDRDGLIKEFDEAKKKLGRETARALAESNRIIEAFGTILAAREAERTSTTETRRHGGGKS